ncbi:MAG: PAS domain-containing methyl-accepting chemotaxis protein [Spirochaetes bacterium]|nr:PAS domain-containing methyl-accepting chemotaxis protein [Spirochaetota bacterium]
MKKTGILSFAVIAAVGIIIMLAIVNSVGSVAALGAALAVLIAGLLGAAAFIVLRSEQSSQRNVSIDTIRVFLETVPTLCAIFDEDGNCLDVNDNAKTILGVTDKRHYHEKKWGDYMPSHQPDGQPSMEKAMQMFKKCLNEGPISYFWTYMTKEGAPVPVEEFLRIINVAGRRRIICYSRDQRALQREKEEVRQTVERINTILDATPMVCAIFDKQSRCQEVNATVTNIFHASREEFINNFEKFMPPFQPDGTPSMEKSIKHIEEAFEKGKVNYEFMYQRRDGTPVPVNETMQRIKINGQERLIAFTRDITENFKLREKGIAAKKLSEEVAQQLCGYVRSQADTVNQSSSSIEGMVASIRKVTETLARNAQNVTDLEKAAEVGRAGLGGMAADIQEIAKESEGLLEINAVMENIAGQTNLLSMNAAIQAAHAGDAGKGFAVVAGEIRKLAESSGNQSKSISAVLKKIKSSIDKITKSMGGVIEKFEVLDSGIKTVAEQENNIRMTMEAKEQINTNLLYALGEVNRITSQADEASRLLLENVRSKS